MDKLRQQSQPGNPAFSGIGTHPGGHGEHGVAGDAYGPEIPREGGSPCRPRHPKKVGGLVYNWDKGQMAVHDLTVTHVLRSSGLNRRTLDPNWAVKEAEAAKIRKEKGVCETRGLEFSPLAIDTMGGLGPEAVRAIEKIANHCRIRNNDQRADRTAKYVAQSLRFTNLKGVVSQIARRDNTAADVLGEERENETEEAGGHGHDEQRGGERDCGEKGGR